MKGVSFLAVIYVLAMVVANLLVWRIGPWFSPINSFVLIGLDLTLRDVMQDRFTRLQMAAVIVIGGLITYLCNPSALMISIGSATAFMASAIADWATYSALKSRSWAIRSNGSNVVGAAVDSILFPTIAFGLFAPWVVGLQFVAKVVGGAAWSWVLCNSSIRKAMQ